MPPVSTYATTVLPVVLNVCAKTSGPTATVAPSAPKLRWVTAMERVPASPTPPAMHDVSVSPHPTASSVMLPVGPPHVPPHPTPSETTCVTPSVSVCVKITQEAILQIRPRRVPSVRTCIGVTTATRSAPVLATVHVTVPQVRVLVSIRTLQGTSQAPHVSVAKRATSAKIAKVRIYSLPGNVPAALLLPPTLPLPSYWWTLTMIYSYREGAH